jgi:hypothetical protein
MRKLYNNVDIPTPTSILQFDNYTTHIIFANDDNSLDESHSDDYFDIHSSNKRNNSNTKAKVGDSGRAGLSNKQKKLIKKSKELMQSHNYHINHVEIPNQERYYL